VEEDVHNEEPMILRRQGQRLHSEEDRVHLQQQFLETFAKTSNILAACREIGIDRRLVYYWKEHDQEFMILFNQANQDATDRLYAEAWRRAVHGDDELVVSMGKIVYEEIPVLDNEGNQKYRDDGKPLMRLGKPLTNRKRSDRLLELLLKARLPEFRDKQTDVNVNVNIDQARETLMNKLAALPEPAIETTVTEIRDEGE
jgi:hypothetical protein